MKHINRSKLPLKAIVLVGGPVCATACGADLDGGDELVEAAVASDCDACRSALGILKTRDVGYNGKPVGVRPEPKYEQQPPLKDKNGDVIEKACWNCDAKNFIGQLFCRGCSTPIHGGEMRRVQEYARLLGDHQMTGCSDCDRLRANLAAVIDANASLRKRLAAAEVELAILRVLLAAEQR